MFEIAAPPGAPPDFGPAEDACWAEPVDADTRALLDGLAASYAAASAAGALPFAVEELPPGPELAGLLARHDVSQPVDGYDVVEAVAAWERLAAWVAAGRAKALAELASRAEVRPAETGYRSVNPITNSAVVVAGRCQLTAKQAEGLVGRSVQLVEDFPDTWAALLAGLIDLRRARVITDELGGQDPAVRRRVEAAVLPRAALLDSVALRKLIKRLLHELAPVEAAERHAIARDSRYVAVTPASDGMAHLEARLPAEDAVALNATLNAAASAAKRADAAAGAPERTHDQRRADALAALGGRPHGRDGGGEGGTGSGVAVCVYVTVPFTTLAGLSDDAGELEGYGAVPADVARELAAHGVWRWLRTDPATGQLLDYGRSTYRPPKALADFIVARDRTCRMPGCHRLAASCDLDHRVPFEAGGATSAENCHALCRTHHLLKHHGDWQVTTLPNGSSVWTGPTGHRFLRPPERAG
ncbi:HNH endonuclease [Jiangella ureilytica]|uniref:HNH endonuclease n=1 Tax=Jiangella ureilytica TaxID=2530374 RepID=A0A4R4RGF9_9ACTN|nr:HNH endonuclease signature motif containing protein [Jiangella ureilytica]TDC48498.1 HNH endonuclease [Jiangella ureilytica]